MKSKFIIGTVLTGMLLSASPVEAMGNATVEFTGNNSIKVGETFTISMNVSDINETYDGVVSLGGNLSFDSTMVEYVSSKEVNAPYEFQINEDYGYKLAGLDFTLDNGIRENVTVYEFTFKALQEGNTTITLTNAKLTDSQDYINTVVLGKDIIIEAKEETVILETPVVETVVEETINTEVKTDEVVESEVKEEIIEVNNEQKEENIVEIEETTFKEEEKVTLIEKVKKVFNDLFTTLRNLFR